MRQVDLGVCPGHAYDRGAQRWSIILPGANYLPDAPLLWFAREACLAAGRNVLAVWDTFDRTTDPQQWVEDRLEAGLRFVDMDARPLLVAKSLTTLASARAARLGLAGVWLTPLIGRASPPFASMVVEGLRAASERSLLVGGTGDPSWDGGVARSVPNATVVEIPAADHALQVPGDLHASLDALRTTTNAVVDFAASIS
jgi:hypothetical protein